MGESIWDQSQFAQGNQGSVEIEPTRARGRTRPRCLLEVGPVKRRRRVHRIGMTGEGVESARGCRFLLRVRRAAGRPGAPRQAGDRRGRRCAGRELRGEGVRGSDADGWTSSSAPTLPATPWSCRRGWTSTSRGEQGSVRGVRGHHPVRRGHLDRRGVPRRRRPPADLGTPTRSRSACASGCASGWACRSRSVWRGRSSSRRSPARSRSPTACSSCSRTRSSASSIRSPWRRSGGRSHHGGEAPRPRRRGRPTGRRAGRGDAGPVARACFRAPSPRARAQSRPTVA